MAKAEAYCVEMKRNVTIFEARDYFLGLPEPRQKLTFLCGDERCRAILRPAVIGENYHKAKDAPDKRKSPCFRENVYHQHIGNCTWISNSIPGEIAPTAKAHNARVSQACAELGLIFRPYPGRRKAKPIDAADITASTTSIHEAGTHGSHSPSSKGKQRPETNRFMATVAMLHLNFTEEQKRKTPLVIENIVDGSFYDVCTWVKWFHPRYQSRHIYYGRCDVESLTNVIMVKFWGKISPVGDRDDKTATAEISLSKAWLIEENTYLLSVLEGLAKPKKTKEEARCYFFSEEPPKVRHFPSKHEGGQGRTVARFSVESLDHIAVIPLSELTEPEHVEHDK